MLIPVTKSPAAGMTFDLFSPSPGGASAPNAAASVVAHPVAAGCGEGTFLSLIVATQAIKRRLAVEAGDDTLLSPDWYGRGRYRVVHCNASPAEALFAGRFVGPVYGAA